MDQAQIANFFREQELIRRRERIARLQNELALEKEPLNEFDKEVDVAARKALARRAYSFEAQVNEYRIGYWRRLWLAICGRAV